MRTHPGGSPDRLDRSAYTLAIDDAFDGPELDRALWLPWYLPHWSSRSSAAARYAVGRRGLTLRIDAHQPPWNPDLDPGVRVSSLQTGQRSGPLGSTIGQHRFRDGLTVREEQETRALFAPRLGLFEVRLRAPDDPAAMAALWMIGVEDEPEHSAEICVCEIFGRDVAAGSLAVGVGVHPFGDPRIVDEFERLELPIEGRIAHEYAAEWTPELVAFYVDEALVKVVPQSPTYPMQVMLSLYAFDEGVAGVTGRGRFPKVATVERFRAWRPIAASA
jgi:hypothetical protein